MRLGSAGKELDGCQTKIEKPDGEGNGEVRSILTPFANGFIALLIQLDKQSNVRLKSHSLINQ